MARLLAWGLFVGLLLFSGLQDALAISRRVSENGGHPARRQLTPSGDLMSFRSAVESLGDGGGAVISAELTRKLRNAVVQIITSVAAFDVLRPWQTASGGVASGSGFWVKIRGNPYIVTNAHVIEDSMAIVVRIPDLGEETFAAQVVAVCHQKDVALVMIKASATPRLRELLRLNKAAVEYLEFGDSDAFQQGSTAIAVGFPLGQANLKFSTGIVSGLEHCDDRLYLQVTSPINHGNSGGPLLDARGKVFGINTAAIESASNVGYALPSRHFVPLLESFVPRDGKPLVADGDDSVSVRPGALHQFPLLGVELDSATEETAAFLGFDEESAGAGEEGVDAADRAAGLGVLVRKVSRFGLFADAGVQPHDLLLEFDGRKLDRFGQTVGHHGTRLNIYDLAERLPIGRRVELRVWRASQHRLLRLSAVFKAPEAGKSARDADADASAAVPTDYAIRYVYEPLVAGLEYEVFGGLVFMQATTNHVRALSAAAGTSAAVLALDGDDGRLEPRVIITALFAESRVPEWSVLPGDVVARLNGHGVRTLDDLRKHFTPELEPAEAGGKGKGQGKDKEKGKGSGSGKQKRWWVLETDAGSIVVLDFVKTLLSEAQLSAMHNYKPSATVEQAVRLATSETQSTDDEPSTKMHAHN